MKVSTATLTVCSILSLNQREAYVVGGAVRDDLLGLEPHDIDIATDALPNEVNKIFTDNGYLVVPIGEKFGTMQVIDPYTAETIEITTYRSEAGYNDRRHPEKIKFEKFLLDDLQRRDFTINAIAYDPIKEEYVDPFQGQRDLSFGTIRAVGNAVTRFDEDPLRMMRMCRFAAQFGFNVSLPTKNAAEKVSYLIREVSGERVRDELLKMMSTKEPQIGVELMRVTGLLKYVLPEVDRLWKIKQPPHHHKYDVYKHSVAAMQNLAWTGHADKPYLVLVGLLHDIGKTEPRDTSPYFPYHIDDGVKMLDDIFNRLKFSNEKRRYVRFLVRHHMDGFIYARKYNQRSIRRYLSKIKNQKLLGDLYFLMIADIEATGYAKPEVITEIQRWMATIDKVLKEKQPFCKKDLAITGHDLIDLGIPACPALGEIQKILVKDVIENPSNNNREWLLERAQQIYKFLMA